MKSNVWIDPNTTPEELALLLQACAEVRRQMDSLAGVVPASGLAEAKKRIEKLVRE